MKIVKSIKQMSDYSKQLKKKGKSIGFVPTMGYLHLGHFSLIRQARKDTDAVVVSIFVNPLQFGPKEDFKKYPRNPERDKRLAKKAGADVIFTPSDCDMYPPGYLTYVDVDKITEVMCGASRPGHFKGVTTVVTKLFNIVQPDIAYFGQKDAQQAVVCRKMADDLNMPIKLKVMPIIRESNGLAMSSRNSYLSVSERNDAAVLYSSLQKAKSLIKSGERDSYKIKHRINEIITGKKSARIDYISIVDPYSLVPIKRISGEVLIALAVFIGKTKLIDNIIIKVN